MLMLMLVHVTHLNSGVDRIVLVCSVQALQVCGSWGLHKDGGTWTQRTNSHVDLWSGSGRSEADPQDKFRQAYVVKSSSEDTGAKQGLHSEPYSVSQSGHNPSVQYYLSSLAKPRWHKVDAFHGNVPPKPAFSQSFMAASSAIDSSNPHSGGLRTLPGQQSTRTGQYAPSKPGVHSPKVSTQQSSVWHPPSVGKVHPKPGLDTSAQWTGLNGKGGFKPPKEFVSSTSGLSRGRKVYLKDVSKKHSSSQSHINPVLSNIRERYELPLSRHFGLHPTLVSGSNQHPQFVSLFTGSSPAPVAMTGHELQGRPGPGEQFAPTIVHHIPWLFGGHPIKRLGDEEPVETTTTTKRPPTRIPTKTYTFPPRRTEPYRPPPPNVHKKSKWMRIRSHQLIGLLGTPEIL